MLLPIELIFIALLAKFVLSFHLTIKFWRNLLWHRFLYLCVVESVALGLQLYTYWDYLFIETVVPDSLLLTQALLRMGLFISLLVWIAKDILILRIYKVIRT